jgi:hypothetical protein
MTDKTKIGGATSAGGLDLADLDTVAAANEGAAMVLMHPGSGEPLRDGNGEAVAVTLAGMDSEVYRKAQRAAINRRLAAGKRGKITIEDYEHEQIELLACCTLAWHGVVLNGEALECTQINVRRLYQTLPWVREQADAFVAERANFIRS